MRITIVLGPFLPIPPVLGGAVEKVHLLLAAAYRAAGHDVTMISRRYKDLAQEEIVDGIKHIRVASSDRSSSLGLNLAIDLYYALRVARSLPQSDITITNSFSLPLVLPRRRAGKIYVHVARFPKRQMALYFRADRLQAISHAVADAIAEQAPWLASRVVSIGYPIPDGYFRRNGTQQPKQRTILFVGRIAREKGVHLLVKAFAAMVQKAGPGALGEWKLRIVGPHEVTQGGDGRDYLNELLALARRLGSSCEFVGPVFSEDDLIAEYQAASVFVYPSLAERGEAFGLAPLEAMAAGCAVVVSNLRCFDDFIEDGVSGLKFDHRRPNAEEKLSSELLRLIAQPQLLAQIATNGYVAAHGFRTPAIAARMLEDFAVLAGNRPR
jgi:glycosyltransferase involved in cell wall biosynthesis